MKRFAMLLAMMLMLWLAARASAMNSTHYRLDWFTPLTTAGGGSTTSTHYAANFSIGQTVAGSASSSHYQATLGYWVYAETEHYVFLPLVLK
jgi:hypothetical protein